MNIPKIFKSEDLYLLVNRSGVKFGELNKESIFIALDKMSYARPDFINSADSGDQFAMSAYSLKSLYDGRGNSVLQMDFSLTENEVLKSIYKKGEVDYELLRKIEFHLSASIVGRKMHSRGNVELKKDLFELNSQSEM